MDRERGLVKTSNVVELSRRAAAVSGHREGTGLYQQLLMLRDRMARGRNVACWVTSCCQDSRRVRAVEEGAWRTSNGHGREGLWQCGYVIVCFQVPPRGRVGAAHPPILALRWCVAVCPGSAVCVDTVMVCTDCHGVAFS